MLIERNLGLVCNANVYLEHGVRSMVVTEVFS